MWNLVNKWEKIWLTDWVAGGHWILSCTYAFRHPLVMPRRVWAKRIQGPRMHSARRCASMEWYAAIPQKLAELCCDLELRCRNIGNGEQKMWLVCSALQSESCLRTQKSCVPFQKKSGFWIPNNWDMLAYKTIVEEKSPALDQNKKLPHWVHNTYAPLR